MTDLRKEDITVFEDDRRREVAFLHARGQVPPIIRFVKTWDLEARASVIRLIVRDRFTGRYGVLDLQVSKIPRAEGS